MSTKLKFLGVTHKNVVTQQDRRTQKEKINWEGKHKYVDGKCKRRGKGKSDKKSLWDKIPKKYISGKTQVRNETQR
jgi:hypothetical protein